MVLVREEGWKEVKLTVVSEVAVRPASERVEEGGVSRRASDRLVKLFEHSYQAGLWDAETLGQYQYAEGLRRGLDRVTSLSSVNDGAVWADGSALPSNERVTALNFPEAVQIIDWSHASGSEAPAKLSGCTPWARRSLAMGHRSATPGLAHAWTNSGRAE